MLRNQVGGLCMRHVASAAPAVMQHPLASHFLPSPRAAPGRVPYCDSVTLHSKHDPPPFGPLRAAARPVRLGHTAPPPPTRQQRSRGALCRVGSLIAAAPTAKVWSRRRFLRRRALALHSLRRLAGAAFALREPRQIEKQEIMRKKTAYYPLVLPRKKGRRAGEKARRVQGALPCERNGRRRRDGDG